MGGCSMQHTLNSLSKVTIIMLSLSRFDPFSFRSSRLLWMWIVIALLWTFYTLADPTTTQQTCQTEADGSVTCSALDDAFEIINESSHRADVYLEDGRFGKFVVSVNARNGKVSLPLLTLNDDDKERRYFVTKHGVRQALVDLDTDQPFRFTITGEPGSFVIPRNAAPSTNPCQDRYEICAKEAQRGECWVNPGWMIVHCCQSCNLYMDAASLVDPKVRCSREHLNITEPFWRPGDLNALFVSWATNPEFQQYSPRVLSSPHAEYQPSSTSTESPPWVIVFDNFLTSEEADALIQGGRLVGFERSTDQGKINALGEQERVTSTSRTSSNAWCRGPCERMSLVQAVTSRIEAVTNIPKSYYENFQILQYEHGQFYRVHHDSGSTGKVSGPRILTFFLYLSDVQEGGETAFPKLDLVVPPAKGRALIWPSVRDENPETPDPRMVHEARPVIQGVKYAANHWIHLYPFQTANQWGCTGAFA